MRFAVVVVLCAVGLFSLASATGAPWPDGKSPLTEFINHIPAALDWVYNWTIVGNPIKAKFMGKGYTGYNMFLTSTAWLTPDETINGYKWVHWVQIAIPDNVIQTNLSCIYITGGSTPNINNPPSSINEAAVSIAVEANTVAAALLAAPNEPITFVSDPGQSRSEDAIIAYTWGHFINNTLEPDWGTSACFSAVSELHIPMAKASIKAMDAIQEWSNGRPQGIQPIQRFAVAGASKRGWTTWLVGAYNDPRVVCIVPIVAPIINMIPQVNEMWEAYGQWSFALQDYVNEALMGWLNLPVFVELLRIIDPINYIEAMTRQPKYMVMACGDEFFMPDSAKYFWDELPGEKILMMVPNAEHSLAGHAWDVLGSVAQIYRTFLNNTQVRPTYSWKVTDGGQTIRVEASTQYLVGAHVYLSRNNTKRDWRLITCSNKSVECVNLALWEFKKLDPISPGVYQYTLELPPANHWSAFFIQLEYQIYSDATVTAKYDSRMSIIPETMPYQHCPQNVCACGYNCACVQNCVGTPNNPTPPATVDMLD